MLLENRSGYDTRDLRRFFHRAFRALGFSLREVERLEVLVTAAPARSRGCAVVGGRRISISIASPHRFSMRRLCRLLMHEAAHLKGLDHPDMDEDLLYSLGPTPEWGRDVALRYRGRAPNQLRGLDMRRFTRRDM